jgi:hypothetical protein
MDGLHVVAQGTDAGVSWVIWARRDEPRHGDLLSMIRLTDPTGRIVHAGASGGPPLPPGRLLEVSTSGSEEGPRALLARVHPSVRRLELRSGGGTRAVPLFDCPEIPEVRFGALLLPRDSLLDSVAAFDGKGAELERFDLRFQQGRWEARHVNGGPQPAILKGLSEFRPSG